MKDDTVPLELDTRKEKIIVSKKFHKFLLHLKNTTPKLLYDTTDT